MQINGFPLAELANCAGEGRRIRVHFDAVVWGLNYDANID